MSGIKGNIMNDALLGLFIMSLITGLVLSAGQLKSELKMDADCQRMNAIWENTEALDACFPKKELPIENLLETGGSAISGELPLNPDLPLLN